MASSWWATAHSLVFLPSRPGDRLSSFAKRKANLYSAQSILSNCYFYVILQNFCSQYYLDTSTWVSCIVRYIYVRLILWVYDLMPHFFSPQHALRNYSPSPVSPQWQLPLCQELFWSLLPFMLQFPPVIPNLDLKTEPSPQREAPCAYTISPNQFYRKTFLFDRIPPRYYPKIPRKELAQTAARVSLIHSASSSGTAAASRPKAVSTTRVNN